MLIILPLLTALSSMPAMASSYSSSERRTLQSAISSALHSAEINRYYQQCREQPTEGEIAVIQTDKEQSRMLAMLQSKVHTQDLNLLLAADNKLTNQVKHGINTPTDCQDTKALQTLIDNYEVALFSLDIAMPLERQLISKASSAKTQANAQQQEVNKTIADSHAIALVTVVSKQQLNAVQQANYLHPDYESNYVFKVMYGWQGNISHYLGMHISVADNEINTIPKQWLIFLDKNGHFIKAISADKAITYLNVLSDAQWRYDVYGNLHRN
ncbi:hypothetical protein [Rheinheimera metallidurans]|uniref:hypothetical protein n=1 Tax=Rheinheimera metallidurans TaxID=2925781 RepID=UPI0030017344